VLTYWCAVYVSVLACIVYNTYSLRQVLDDRSLHMPTAQRLRIAVDVAEGMLYLHSREQVRTIIIIIYMHIGIVSHAVVDSMLS
jgi:hypothetical protein